MNNAVIANVLTAIVIVASVAGFAYSVKTDQALTDLRVTYIQNDIVTLRNILGQISRVVINSDEQTRNPLPSSTPKK